MVRVAGQATHAALAGQTNASIQFVHQLVERGFRRGTGFQTVGVAFYAAEGVNLDCGNQFSENVKNVLESIIRFISY